MNAEGTTAVKIAPVPLIHLSKDGPAAGKATSDGKSNKPLLEHSPRVASANTHTQ